MVASKFLNDEGEDDEVFNAEWALSGDLTILQINQLEKDFLKAIVSKLNILLNLMLYLLMMYVINKKSFQLYRIGLFLFIIKNFGKDYRNWRKM